MSKEISKNIYYIYVEETKPYTAPCPNIFHPVSEKKFPTGWYCVE